MAKAKLPAIRWAVYRSVAFSAKPELLGHIRAHTLEAAQNEADQRRRFDRWDEILPADEIPQPPATR